MPKDRRMCGLYLDEEMQARLEKFVTDQPVPPKKNSVILKALDQFLKRNGV